MIDQAKALIREENMCVLATDAGGRPYCSLMAYVNHPSCEEIYMATHRNTQKYKNLLANPAVSLLIDSRERLPRNRVRALTLEGSLRKIDDANKLTGIRSMLLEKHPYLSDFISHEDVVIFCIKVSACLFLKGLNESHFQEP